MMVFPGVRTSLTYAGIGLIAASLFAGDLAAQTIDEIIVTARKRKENLFDVPLNISSIDEQTMERANVFELEDLAAMTPGLAFQDVNGAYQNTVIRGLAQTTQTSLQGNVGVFLDGVYLNNRSGLEFGVLDLERIEVIKGPQSALYGRNTFSGAINYVTKSPVLGEFSGKIRGTLGTDERQALRASISVPFGDKAAVRFFGGVSEFDGTIDNARDGGKLGGYSSRDAYGISLLAEPTDNFSIRIFAAHNEQANDAPALQLFPTRSNNCGSTTVNFPGGTGFNTLFCGAVPKADSVDVSPVAVGLTGDTDLYYAQVEWDMSIGTLSFLASKVESEFELLVDTSTNPIAVNIPFFIPGLSVQTFIDASTPEGDAESYELRLASNSDGPFSWSIGGFYYDSVDEDVLEVLFQPLHQPLAQPVPFFGRGNRISTDAYAIFGSLAYQLNDQWSGSIDVRYADEEQDLVGTGLTSGVTGSQSFDYVTPRFTLEYASSDNMLWYASAARGVKVGGFNSNAAGRPEFTFGEESNWTYELGLKATLLNNRLVLTGNIFHIDWEDLQIQAAIPGSTVSVNVNSGGALSSGFELDATAYITDNFWIRGAVAVLDPRYKSGVSDGEVLSPCGELIGSRVIVSGCSSMVGGNQLARTTDTQFAFNANYTVPDLIGDFDFYLRGDYSFQESSYNLSLNQASQGDISLLNLRAGLVSERLEITVWVDNVLDEKWNRRVTIAPSTTDGAPLSGVQQMRMYPGALQSAGVDLTWNF